MSQSKLVPTWRPGAWLAAAEEYVATTFLVLLSLVPVAEAIIRKFGPHIPNAESIIRHFLLPITYLGASLASKHKQHFSILLGLEKKAGWIGAVAVAVPRFFTALFSTVFLLAAISSIQQFPEFTTTAWFIPVVIFLVFIPLGFLIMLARIVPKKAESPVWLNWTIFVTGVVAGLFLALPSIQDALGFMKIDVSGFDNLSATWVTVVNALKPFLIILLAGSLFIGTPIFVVLGGIATLLYSAQGFNPFMSADPVLTAGYELTGLESVPAIALFSFTGFILSESKSGERFVRFFKNLFAKVPGGIVIVTVLVSAFFTTFTGASGVTILALGGLLYAFIYEGGKNNSRFSTGLLTSSGSIGLLFPPSLAVIMYGSVAQVNIFHMFIAGVLPGLLMLLAMIVAGYFMSNRQVQVQQTFSFKETGRSFLDAFWELMLPVVIVIINFSGLATLTETAAFAAIYALIIEIFVRREIAFKALLRLSVKALVVVGSVLIILSMARGLQNFLKENDVPRLVVTWFTQYVHQDQTWLFLLLLNVLLLIVGSFMDIFSAIFVVVPFLLLLAEYFGVSKVQLGIIFLANLEVGFMMPPAGINLFLSSYRFNKPLVEVYRSVWPFMLVQIAVVLVISYVPWLSSVLLPADAFNPPTILSGP